MSGHTPWREIKHKKDKPTQTTPQGLEIPVPKRRDFMEVLLKVLGPPKKKP
jgi:hypothetical protein